VQGAKWLNLGADIVERFEDFEKELTDHDRAMNLLTKDDKFVGTVTKEQVVIEALVDSTGRRVSCTTWAVPRSNHAEQNEPCGWPLPRGELSSHREPRPGQGEVRERRRGQARGHVPSGGGGAATPVGHPAGG
jgi:hypothetical protein